MEKKTYITPVAVFVNIDTSTMLAASIEIGRGEVDAGQSFTIERRGTWGNLWK